MLEHLDYNSPDVLVFRYQDPEDDTIVSRDFLPFRTTPPCIDRFGFSQQIMLTSVFYSPGSDPESMRNLFVPTRFRNFVTRNLRDSDLVITGSGHLARLGDEDTPISYPARKNAYAFIVDLFGFAFGLTPSSVTKIIKNPREKVWYLVPVTVGGSTVEGGVREVPRLRTMSMNLHPFLTVGGTHAQDTSARPLYYVLSREEVQNRVFKNPVEEFNDTEESVVDLFRNIIPAMNQFVTGDSTPDPDVSAAASRLMAMLEAGTGDGSDRLVSPFEYDMTGEDLYGSGRAIMESGDDAVTSLSTYADKLIFNRDGVPHEHSRTRFLADITELNTWDNGITARVYVPTNYRHLTTKGKGVPDDAPLDPTGNIVDTVSDERGRTEIVRRAVQSPYGGFVLPLSPEPCLLTATSVHRIMANPSVTDWDVHPVVTPRVRIQDPVEFPYETRGYNHSQRSTAMTLCHVVQRGRPQAVDIHAEITSKNFSDVIDFTATIDHEQYDNTAKDYGRMESQLLAIAESQFDGSMPAPGIGSGDTRFVVGMDNELISIAPETAGEIIATPLFSDHVFETIPVLAGEISEDTFDLNDPNTQIFAIHVSHLLRQYCELENTPSGPGLKNIRCLTTLPGNESLREGVSEGTPPGSLLRRREAVFAYTPLGSSPNWMGGTSRVCMTLRSIPRIIRAALAGSETLYAHNINTPSNGIMEYATLPLVSTGNDSQDAVGIHPVFDITEDPGVPEIGPLVEELFGNEASQSLADGEYVDRFIHETFALMREEASGRFALGDSVDRALATRNTLVAPVFDGRDSMFFHARTGFSFTAPGMLYVRPDQSNAYQDLVQEVRSNPALAIPPSLVPIRIPRRRTLRY